MGVLESESDDLEGRAGGEGRDDNGTGFFKYPPLIGRV